jgi:hypothetical protein
MNTRANFKTLYLSLIAAFVAQLCFKLDLNVSGAVLLYLFAAYFFSKSLLRESEEQFNREEIDTKHHFIQGLLFSTTKEAELARIFILLFVAAFFRLFRIESVPGGIWIDESFTGVNALEIIDGKYAPLWGVTPLNKFRPEWVKTSNVYLYYVVFVLKEFGSTHLGLKMVSVIPGIAAVVADYFLFKTIAPLPVAFLSALLIAVSHWSVTTSRWGWDEVLMCFLQATAYYFLIKGLNSNRRRYLILSGLTLGLCLYTYIASSIVVGIPLVYFIIKIMLEPRDLRAHLQKFLTVFLPCALVFLPLGLHYLSQPGDFSVRLREVSILEAFRKTDDYSPLWESTKKYLLMFNYKGSADPRHNLANEPQLDFVTSIFFVLGLAFYLRVWKRSYNLLLLVWFFLGISGGLLTDPTDAPNAYRTAMINPVVCLFAASSICQSLIIFCQRLPSFRAKSLILFSSGIALAVYVTTDNYFTYFIRRPASPDSWREDNLDWGIPKVIRNLHNETSLIYLDPLLLWDTVLVNSWYLNYQPGKLFQPAYAMSNIFHRISVFSSIRDAEIVYIAPPFLLPVIQRLFPESRPAVVFTPFGDPLYIIAKLQSRDWQNNLQAANNRYLADLAYRMGSLYRKRAESVLPFGPLRKLIFERASEEFEYAKELESSP